MGNSVSVPPVIPLSFSDCFINGKLDVFKYQMYFFVKRKRERDECIFNVDNIISSEETKPPPAKRIRTVKKHEVIITHPNGSTSYMEPTNSLWYTLYVQSGPTSKKSKKYFRKRFCLSHR